METSHNEASVAVIIEDDNKSDSCDEGDSSSSNSSNEDSGEEENPCSPPSSANVSVLSKSTTSGTPRKIQGIKKKTWQNRNGGNVKNYKGPSRNNFNQGNSKLSGGCGKSGFGNQSKSDLNSNKIRYSASPDKSKGNCSYTPDRNKGSCNNSPDKKDVYNYSPDKNKDDHSSYDLSPVSAGNCANDSEKSGKKNGNGGGGNNNGNKNKNGNGNQNSSNKSNQNNGNPAVIKNNNEKSDKVKIGILQQLQYFGPWLTKRKGNHSPFNTTVMQLHTKWTVWFFFQIAMIVWQNWYWKEGLIVCINQMDAKKAVDHYLNICLSYLFAHMTEKRYLMHYRWIHWMFGLLAAAYFVLKPLTRVLDSPRVKQFLEDVARLSQRYDKSSVDQTKKEVVAYFQVHAGHHQGLYMKLILVHALAYLLDLAVIVFINFALQGQFMFLVPEAFPFQRDYVGFTDHLSTVFPPFASCTFNKEWGMHVSRTEHYACHLTLMELYEKVFIFVWLWMVLLVVWSSLYLVFLFVAVLPPVWPIIQQVAAVKHIKKSVSKTWGLDDFYVLFCVKRRISAAAFIQITEELGISISSGCRDVEQGTNKEYNYKIAYQPSAIDVVRNETERAHLDHIGFCEQVLSGGNDAGNKLFRRQKKHADLYDDLKDCEL